MKKMIIYVAVILLAVACNNKKAEDSAATGTAAAAPADMPYTLEKPWMDWKTGDPKNAETVMKMIKAWENKNIDQCLSYFGDSTYMVFDKYRKKLSHDSIKPFLLSSLADYKSVKVEMQDWESVVSADKEAEWVTLWYKQTMVDNKGVTDSMDISDEARLKNGKITAFVEFSQHFPDGKKMK